MILPFIDTPLEFNKNFYSTKKNIEDIEKVVLFNQYECKLQLFKHWFNKCSIDFIINSVDNESVREIDEKLINLYGNPVYLAMGYKRVWKKDKYYILHGMEEDKYGSERHDLCVSFIKPIGMFNYNKFMEYEKIIKKVFTEWNITRYSVNASLLGEFMTIFDTESFSYLISIKKRQIKYFSSEIIKAGNIIRIKPSWNTKSNFKKLDDLYSNINSFFDCMEEYDINLKNISE